MTSEVELYFLVQKVIKNEKNEKNEKK